MFELNTELLFTWLSRALVMFACMPIHEAAHAFAADRMGDPTPRNAGRLTLNPFAHLDLFGGILLITAGFGWAKPVPVNAGRFKRPKLGMAITAAAGPLSNLLMATLLMAVYKVIYYNAFMAAMAGSLPSSFEIAISILNSMVVVNVYLAVFNLLPVPPLDGSKLFGAILPDRIYFGMMRYERYIMIAIIALAYMGILSTPLNYLSQIVIGFLNNVVTRPVDLLMEGLLIG